MILSAIAAIALGSGAIGAGVAAALAGGNGTLRASGSS